MRVLVTGGAGYIGSHTVRLLDSRGHSVWIYDNLSRGHAAAVPQDRLIVGDLADTSRLDQALAGHAIEAVIHFAGLAYVGESVHSPALYYQNNVANSLNLMECMRRRGISRLVFSSSCTTYGSPTELPIPETHPQSPVNPYGHTKLAIERALLDYADAYGWGAVILRYFNAAGASGDGVLGEDHDPETHLIPLALFAALGLRPSLTIFGTDYPTADGTCIRDYIHVEDLAEAHLLALERLAPGKAPSYNVGLGRGYSVREVVAVVEDVTGRPVPIIEGPRREGDPPALVASCLKIRQVLAWRPRYQELRGIVETAWRWHRNHPQGYTP
ncbi:MAG TPA: UDP-glucose 4-epimerase GalE [Candidatus Acidoferrum sp.]|nr:UDP-glucose 4-epimerase GalE [Candidatus Acidoferrum sp.]